MYIQGLPPLSAKPVIFEPLQLSDGIYKVSAGSEIGRELCSRVGRRVGGWSSLLFSIPYFPPPQPFIPLTPAYINPPKCLYHCPTFLTLL